MTELLARFEGLLRSVTEAEIKEDVTLGGQLLLEQAGDLKISYAPFEHIQTHARIVIVGITPGAQQACNSLLEARRQLLQRADLAEALAKAKVHASFSGPMRTNLVEMLDFIGVHRLLGLTSAAQLWAEQNGLVHFTSAVRFPTFVKDKNYNGQPPMTSTPALLRVLDRCLREEGEALNEALWVPLGPVAMQGVKWLVGRGIIKPTHVLEGLPHPSGANAERVAYFVGRKSRMALSKKTNAAVLDQLRERLSAQVLRLCADCDRPLAQA